MTQTTELTALRLAEIAMGGGNRALESKVRVLVLRPGAIGPSPAVAVVGASHGFDWDNGSLLLQTDQPLTTLTPDDVAAIRESVRKGSSWHAYEKWKKQQARIEELEAQVAALQAEGKQATVPSDAEIDAAIQAFDWDGWIDQGKAKRAFTREALARWAAPAHPAEGVPAQDAELDIDGLIDRLLDAQQDLNLAANVHMDQSIASASTLLDEVEIALRTLAATHPTQQGIDAQRWQIVRQHISAEYSAGHACFVVHVQPMSGANIMRGSVAEHFTKAVDDRAKQIKIADQAWLAAQAKQGEQP